MGINSWLENKEYFNSIEFKNKEYLGELFHELKEYLWKSPSPFHTEWIDKRGIEFRLGNKIRKIFKPDTDIAPRDFISLIEQWAVQYYPQYIITEVFNRPLTSDEKVEGIKRGEFTFDDSFNIQRSDRKIEKGIITRVFFFEERFTIEINGKKFIRVSGTPSHPLPISQFLKDLRQIRDYGEKKSYIFSHSTLDNKDVKIKDIEIYYTGKKLLNFFKINFLELSSFQHTDMGKGFFKFGRFLVNFGDNEELKKDCFDILNFQKNKHELDVDVNV